MFDDLLETGRRQFDELAGKPLSGESVNANPAAASPATDAPATVQADAGQSPPARVATLTNRDNEGEGYSIVSGTAGGKPFKLRPSRSR